MMAEESNFYHTIPQLLTAINRNLERIAVALEENNRNTESQKERSCQDDR